MGQVERVGQVESSRPAKRPSSCPCRPARRRLNTDPLSQAPVRGTPPIATPVSSSVAVRSVTAVGKLDPAPTRTPRWVAPPAPHSLNRLKIRVPQAKPLGIGAMDMLGCVAGARILSRTSTGWHAQTRLRVSSAQHHPPIETHVSCRSAPSLSPVDRRGTGRTTRQRTPRSRQAPGSNGKRRR